MAIITPEERRELKMSWRFRRAVFEHRFDLFWYWYFGRYVTHKSAWFHYEMFNDLRFRSHRYLMWVMFRESAKTAIMRGFVTWCIVYKKKYNIHWIAFDTQKAVKNTRAIANELQANESLINDYGMLYYEEQKPRFKKSIPKQLKQFKCVNGVMVTASSVNISGRGELEDEHRPDLLVFDDFENELTKGSRRRTERVISGIDERLAGCSANSHVVLLCNYIWKHGSVATFMRRARESKDWKLRFQPLIDNGEIQWPARYVWTRAEADELNKKLVKEERVMSIEALKENDGGSANFNQERNLIPKENESAIVKAEWYMNGRGRYKTSELYYSDETGRWNYLYNGKWYRGVAVTAIDPAVSTKKTADERAICSAVGVAIKLPEAVLYYYLFLSCRAGRWTIREFTEQLRREIANAHSQVVGCESNSVQGVFREIFAMHDISTIALNPDGDKVRRMYKHVGDMEFGRVLFPDNGKCDDLLDEYIAFTGEDGNPDNRVDSANYALDMLKSRPKSVRTGKPSPTAIRDVVHARF